MGPKYINGITLLGVSRNQTKVLYVPSDSNVVSFTFRIIMFNWVHVENVQECLGLSVKKLCSHQQHFTWFTLNLGQYSFFSLLINKTFSVTNLMCATLHVFVNWQGLLHKLKKRPFRRSCEGENKNCH